MADDRVEDEELLYRRVKNDPQFFSVSNGVLRLSSCAFNDPGMSGPNRRPSVDRATLLDFDASRAKTVDTQGVVGLVTADVRAIGAIEKKDAAGQVTEIHKVDVVPDPIEGNPAHALVIVAPDFTANRSFDRLKDALCRIAERGGWLVEPS